MSETTTMKTKPRYRNVTICLQYCVLILFAPTLFGQQQPAWLESIQNLKVHHIGIEAGLSQGTNYTLLRDKRGFLWFTSYEGLNRYDGHRVTVYRNGEGDCEVKGSNTTGLVEDKAGNIWFGTEMGLNAWIFEEDCFHFFPIHDTTNQLIPSLTYPFHSDSISIWYFNDYEGIVQYFFDSQQKKVVTDEWKYSQTTNRINSIFYDSKNRIWIREETGLILFDAETNKRTYFFSAHPDNLLGEEQAIYCLMEADDDDFWLGADRAIFRLNPSKGELDTFDVSKQLQYSKIADIKRFRDSLLWVGSGEEGSLIFHLTTQEIFPFTKENGLTNNSSANLLVDDQGIVWINVDPNGINQISHNFSPFQNYTAKNLDPERFSNLSIKSFFEMPNGNVWVGTETSGIFLFNPTKNAVEKIIQVGHPYLNFSDQGNAFWLEDGKILWIGTFFGISRFDLSTNTFLDRITFPNNVDANYISDFLEMKDGTLWIATEGGLYYKLKGDPEIYQLDTLTSIRANRLQEDHQGRLLFTEPYNGLHQLTIAQSSATGKLLVSKNRHFFPNRHIKHFYHQQADSLLWMATDNGLLKVQIDSFWTATELLKRYSVKDGLPSDYIYSVLPDGKEDVWLSTNHGLVKFSTINEQFYTYTPADGLQGYEYNTNSFLQSSNGDFYFGGVNGFNKFNPSAIEEAPLSPKPEFVDFKVNERPLKQAGYVGANSQLELNYDQNTIELGFVSPDFFNRGRNEYQYTLNGFDKEWIKAGKRNIARYTKLPPGKYTFQVKSSNSHTWNQEANQIAITIFPPWWRTYWAYVLYLLVGGFVFYSIYRFLLNKRLSEAEAARLTELDQLKTKLYTNITHEFRTPLTVIQGMADDLEKHLQKEPLYKLGLIKKNSHQLLNLVNQMLDLSKIEAGKSVVHYQQDDLVAFLKYATKAQDSYATLNGIDLQFYAEEDQLIMDFDNRKMEQLLSNLLSNAIKFTPTNGKVLVTIKQIKEVTPPQVEIKVIDDGIGIAAEQLPYIFDRFHRVDDAHQSIGTGIGLAVVKELVRLMEGTIDVKSKLEKGTTFILTFPIRQQALAADFSSSYTFQRTIDSTMPIVTNDHSYLLDLPLVLIVEDNKDVAFYIKNCLHEKYRILIAANGRIGLELAFEKIPDLIISDVMMPEMDGFELCHQLKTDERTNHIPLILLTAKATTQDKLEGLQQGADAYLLKPFEPKELLVRIQKLLELRRLLQLKYNQASLPLIASKKSKRTVEQAFLQKAEAVILEHLEEEDFGGAALARALLLSRSQLYRKIKALTGMSTAIYIRHVRLLQAKVLLQEGKVAVAEVAYQVGFKSPAYFSQTFKRTFGVAPSAIRSGERIT